MHWLKCSLLLATLCIIYWQDSAASTELINNIEKNCSEEISRENEVNLKLTDSAEFFPNFKIKITPDFSSNVTKDLKNFLNITDESKDANITNSETGIQFNFNSEQKQEATNVTLKEIKPLLLFPILPFLFPSKEKKNQSSKNKFLGRQNEKIKENENPNSVKPFIFFDFAFIRRIPLNNTLNNTKDSNIINVKKLKMSQVDDSKKNSLKNRRRRNTSFKLETPELFDESPFFPDSDLDEFLPKSDLFFPDLPFHHRKPLKRLNRRKRDQKKLDLKSDLKFFFDAFDEAFMQTKRELEQTDPILNFLRGGQPLFEEDKKKNIFNQISNIQEKPKMKWRIQRNIKRLKNGHKDGFRRDQEGPTIIVDKVVKIGEFHVPDNNILKKKTRESEFKNKLLDGLTSLEKGDLLHKKIFDLKQEEKSQKKNHIIQSDVQNDSIITTKEKIEPQITIATKSIAHKIKSNVKIRETKIHPEINKTTKNLKYENLINIIDAFKTKIRLETTNETEPNNLNKKGLTYYESLKKDSHEKLKKNITDLLNQFLNLNRNSSDIKLLKRTEHNGHDELEVFDWTEKETLLNTDKLGKNSREGEQKKDPDFIDEYVDLSKKERQIADLNYLFLTVTLPTVLIFGLVLLVCFFSLQVKGKLCTRLFKPRQVLIVEDEKFMQFKKLTPQINPKFQSL